MDIIALGIGFVAGVILTALVSHWLRREKPEVYDAINEKAKRL